MPVLERKRRGGERRRVRRGEGRGKERKTKQKKQSERLRSRLPPRRKPCGDHTDEMRA